MGAIRATAWLALLLACGCSAGSSGGSDGCCENACYPALPSDAAPIYVNPACGSAAPNGTLGKPFHSIVDALKAANDGDAILVAAGDYAEAEPIVIKKDVSLLGMGTFDPDSGTFEDRSFLVVEEVATLSVHGTTGVVVSGLTIAGPAVAGIDVHGATDLILTNNHVATATPAAGGLFGHGIVVSDSEDVIIEGNLIEDCTQIGILVDTSSVTLRANHVSGNRQGIRIDDSPAIPASMNPAMVTPIEVSGNAVISNFTVGIHVVGSVAALAGNRVEDTRPDLDDPDQVADGIVVRQSAEAGAPQARVWLGETPGVDAPGNEIIGSHRCGILISDGAVVPRMDGNQITDNLFGGVWVQNGSRVDAMIANTIGRNAMVGVGLTTNSEVVVGSELAEDFNLIYETAPLEIIVGGETRKIGDGVGVFLGSRATVQHNKILDNHRGGILLDDPDSAAIFIEGNRVDGGTFGIVVQAEEDQPIPPGQISANFSNTMGAETCAPPGCVSPEPADQLVNYGDLPRLTVMDDPILMPCIPPSCTD